MPLAITIAVTCFVAYWITKYFSSISYVLTEDEVVIERGIWWKMKHVVPYARVMSVDIIQGPISRRFGAPGTATAPETSLEILEDLRRIRRALEKR